jgi:hypothetical protein
MPRRSAWQLVRAAGAERQQVPGRYSRGRGQLGCPVGQVDLARVATGRPWAEREQAEAQAGPLSAAAQWGAGLASPQQVHPARAVGWPSAPSIRLRPAPSWPEATRTRCPSWRLPPPCYAPSKRGGAVLSSSAASKAALRNHSSDECLLTLRSATPRAEVPLWNAHRVAAQPARVRLSPCVGSRSRSPCGRSITSLATIARSRIEDECHTKERPPSWAAQVSGGNPRRGQ